MFCQKCGTQNTDDANFCSKCGNNLSFKPEIEKKGINNEIFTAESFKRMSEKNVIQEPKKKGSGWGTILFIIIGLAVLGAISDTNNKSSDTNTVSTPVITSTVTPIPLVKIGERIIVDDFAYTYHGMATSQTIGSYIGSTFYGEQASGKFIILDFTIENVGKDSETMQFSNINIVDDQGRTFQHNWQAEVDLWTDKKEPILNNVQLQPGLPKRGKIVFDVPENINGKIELSGGLFSEKRYISLTTEPTPSTQVKTAGTTTQVQVVSTSSVIPTTAYTVEPVVVASPTGTITTSKITIFRFSVQNVKINVGDEVLWNNFDEDSYIIVELDNKIANITLKGTGKASYIFNRSGSYTFGLYYQNKGNSYPCITSGQCMSTSTQNIAVLS